MTHVYETFITQDEIVLITGYKRPHEQKKWLNHHGWQFLLDSAGRPIIHREVMNSKFGVIANAKTTNKEQSFILDISKVR